MNVPLKPYSGGVPYPAYDGLQPRDGGVVDFAIFLPDETIVDVGYDAPAFATCALRPDDTLIVYAVDDGFSLADNGNDISLVPQLYAPERVMTCKSGSIIDFSGVARSEITAAVGNVGSGLLAIFGAVVVLFVGILVFRKGLRYLRILGGASRADYISESERRFYEEIKN